MTDKDSFHADILEKFEDAQDAFDHNMNRYEADIRFGRMGHQWDDEAVRDREAQGRPTLTINRMPAFIRQVTNDARENKPAIKVHPIDSDGDVETAEVINGLIRNIEQVSKADLAYDTAIECSVSGGFGFFKVDLDYAHARSFDMEIKIERIINPLTVYPDPSSTEADSSDWDYCFVTETMTKAEFEAEFPEAEPVDFSEDWNDWLDRDGGTDYVRVAEYWVREKEPVTLVLLNNGQVVDENVYDDHRATLDLSGIEEVARREGEAMRVKRYILNGQEVLKEEDWPGQYIPIIPVYGEEVYYEGERHFYSLIHAAKDSQKMYNYWRTSTTELVALAPKNPWVGPVGAFDTDPNWQTAHTDLHPTLEYDMKDGMPPPTRQPFSGPPAGALQEALNASDDMKAVMGLHDASLGAQSNEIAGVAIAKRVREGDTSTFHFIDNMNRAIRHLGVIIVDLIPHVYSQQRVIRILGEDNKPQTVAVNREPNSPEEMLQGEQVSERMEAINSLYDLRVGKYDVTIKAGPSYTTQREEARETLVALAQAFPGLAQVAGDLILDTMDFPNADIIAKRLKAALPPGLVDEDDPRLAQMAQQLEQAKAIIQQLQDNQAAQQAQMNLELQKLDIDQTKAKTDRIKVEGELEDKARRYELDKIQVLNHQTGPDETPIIIKEMEIAHQRELAEKQAVQEEFRNDLEARKIDNEARKIDLEEARLAVEESRSVEQSGEIVQAPAQADVPDVYVTIHNEKSGNKRVVRRDGPDGHPIYEIKEVEGSDD